MEIGDWAIWASFCCLAAVIGVTVAIGIAAAAVDIGRACRGRGS
ncbi:MAG TPA: hypothetical protein VFY84_15460 [Jiangellales bacterium]|nr:hypothetical protein [Jiangellales bacterium]